MKQIWTGRAVQAVSTYGEHAPMTTVCCNACRTCVTTNLLGIVTGAAAGAAYAVTAFAKRRLLRA